MITFGLCGDNLSEKDVMFKLSKTIQTQIKYY